MYAIQIVSVTALLAIVPSVIQAQNAQPQDGFSLGLIATIAASPYIGEDTTTGALPLVNYRQGPFSIGFQGLSYDISQSEQLSFTVGVTPRITGLEDPDSDALEGIDRDITADAFAALHYSIGNGLLLETTFRQEMTGEHDGQELQFELGYATRFGTAGVVFGAGARWQSADLANYTWGVSPDEAIVGRPAYDSGDVVIPYLSVETSFPINQNLSLVGNISAEFLPDDVADSPIVEDDTALTAAIGFVYKF